MSELAKTLTSCLGYLSNMGRVMVMMFQLAKTYILLEISGEHGPRKDGEEEGEEQQLQEDPASLKIKLVTFQINILYCFLFLKCESCRRIQLS